MHLRSFQRRPSAPVLLFAAAALSACSEASADASLAAASPSAASPSCVFDDSAYFEQLLGAAPAASVGFIADQPDARGGWANYDGSAWYLASTTPAGTRLSVAVPLFPAIAGTSLAAAAAGNYNQHYVNAARQLLAYGHGNAWVRPGWEFQGDWYAWGYNYPGQNKAGFCSNYTVAFAQVVKSFRSVSSGFRFIWNPSLGDSSQMPNANSCYPGDAYVDSIGLDVYDFNYSNIADPVQRFQHDVMDREYGLQWQLGIAQRHAKTLSYPEWGVGKVGDNPYMIQAMSDWMNAQDTELQCYWNGTAASGYDGNLQDFPQQASMYQALFGIP